LHFFEVRPEKRKRNRKPVASVVQLRRDISSMGAELSKAAADRADVARVRGGDVEAFAAIVRRWQTPLVNLAYRFCGDRGRAEEMAQEAFLRAYRGLDGFRGDAAFSTWLFSLATNVYCSELRRIPQRMVALDEAPEPADPASMIEAHERRDRDLAVRRAVLALPPKYREAMLLFYFHEMDVPAAAQSLGLPEGTVKARLHRGREILRAKLPRLLALTPEGVL
jgi:RNA polymerase sigma-70 factor (ECF subfamily)